MRKRLCTICARGGSRGVPNKNIRLLAGKPLIVHTIEAAFAAGIFDQIVVSSDSAEILEVARKAGVDLIVKRPDSLASDTAGKLDAIIHAVHQAEWENKTQYDTIVDLDATAPLRLPADVVNAVEMLEKYNIKNVTSVCFARRNPYFNIVEHNEKGQVELCKTLKNPLLRRQDAPEVYDQNASIYVWEREAILFNPMDFYDDTKLLVMPEARSIDIDSAFDWFLVEQIMKSKIYLEGDSFEANVKNPDQDISISSELNLTANIRKE